jgi:hypothetical protein
MTGKKIVIGETEWALPDDDAEAVRNQIRTAMGEGGVAELVVQDADKRPVVLYVNCKIVPTIVVDTDGNPRPHEWGG